jgi:uncharacterized protein YbjT (DUF2867 family)
MIVVTGATGNVGRPLVELLRLAGANVRAVTRNPDASFPEGTAVTLGDVRLAGTMEAALRGATGLFLNARAVGPVAADLVRFARAQGVERIVALSAINVDDPLDRQPSRHRGDLNRETERVAMESGLEATSLRASMFASNTIGLWGGQIRASDIVRGAHAASAWAPIDERDIAEVAVGALLTNRLVGQRPELTGAASLTHAEMIAVIGEAIGRPLRYEEVPPHVARAALVSGGLPAPFAEALLALQADAATRPALTTRGVESILGRPARSFSRWARDHAGAFRTPSRRSGETASA